MAVLNLIALVCLMLQTVNGQAVQCVDGRSACDWGPWGEWSRCSKTCGEGTRTRSRGMCCNNGDSFQNCLKTCAVKDDTFEQGICGYKCPDGNCTFNEMKNTSIDATNYAFIKDGTGRRVLNAPLLLRSSKEFCTTSCLNSDLGIGIECWGYTFAEPGTCYLYFFNKPLSLAHPDKVGTSEGNSIFVRQCSGDIECKATQADIVFVVDFSTSIGTENFNKVKQFLSDIVNTLDIDSELTRVGIMLVNDKVTWQFKLDRFDNKLDILKAIRDMGYVSGTTPITSVALETVRTEGFVNDRPGVPKLIVMVTDGQSRNRSLTRVTAATLRQAGVNVYAIGVGNNTNHVEIVNIANTPENKYVYEFSGFNDLDALKVSLNTNLVPCKVCIKKEADIVFVVDASKSIGQTNFDIVKQFIKDVVSNFDIDDRYTRVGIIEFSTAARIEVKLGTHDNVTDLYQAIDNVTYSGGNTLTSDALRLMRTEGFNGERPLAPDVAIVITDGLSKFPTVTAAQANLAKNDGITILAIGIAVLPETYNTRSSTPKTTPPTGCVDIGINCDSYPRDSCTDYEPYARLHCPRKCGFCPGVPVIEPNCTDNIDDCASYGRDICFKKDGYDWVEKNCLAYCGFCEDKNKLGIVTTTAATTTVTTPSVCADKLQDCTDYGGPKTCALPAYQIWAKDNCPKYCGLCYNYRTVTSVPLGNETCPSWTLPEECKLEYKAGQCCPFPVCPSGYRLSVKRI